MKLYLSGLHEYYKQVIKQLQGSHAVDNNPEWQYLEAVI